MSKIQISQIVSDANSFRMLIKESLLIKRDKPIPNHTVNY